MASGIPVISTHVSGIPELIESGVNGALVAPKNERELADLVEETLLSKELSIKLSAKGREKVIEHFNVEKISLELRAFFESMMP
jgi:colanic acid/amylovoran biosynthesis glycosyltransferase